MHHITKSFTFCGQKFLLCGSENDSYFQGITSNLETNSLLIAIMLHQIRAGSTVIDVGANIGLTSIFAHRFIENAEIFSIEPGNVFSALKETLRLNNVIKGSAMQCCVGAKDGRVCFNNALGNSSASHIGGDDGSTIELRSLDSIASECGMSRCDFVKIDVEGFENDVLDGMNDINHKFGPLIFMEFNAYTINALAGRSPVALLNRVIDQFGCFLANTTGTDLEIVHGPGVIPFLHRNMIQRGCVEDIVFSANPERIADFRL